MYHVIVNCMQKIKYKNLKQNFEFSFVLSSGGLVSGKISKNKKKNF